MTLCGAGWSHFAQFTIAVVNNDPKKSKYSGVLLVHSRHDVTLSPWRLAGQQWPCTRQDPPPSCEGATCHAASPATQFLHAQFATHADELQRAKQPLPGVRTHRQQARPTVKRAGARQHLCHSLRCKANACSCYSFRR